MILRRIAEHVKAQNWFAVALDFVIVVLGVFIGLQAQEWGKRQDDRRRERQVIEDLLADIDIDRPQYAEGLAFARRRIAAAQASLAGAGLAPIDFPSSSQPPRAGVVNYSFDPSTLTAAPDERRNRLWSDVIIGFHPTTSDSAFEAMVGAGDTKLIKDRNILRALQLYHNITLTVEDQNDKMLSIRENVMEVGATYGLAPFVDAPAEGYFSLVASEPRLAASIRILATFAMYHYGEIVAADARAAELQDRLRAYLEAAK